MPELELRGGAVLTDGCRRILVLETDKICLDMGRSIVTLYGDSLRIESYNGKRLAVCGKVTGIELSGKWEGQSNG
ncbi:MAG: YabP/YqfC family sporulation protein [Gemmiger sp.]